MFIHRYIVILTIAILAMLAVTVVTLIFMWPETATLNELENPNPTLDFFSNHHH